MRKNSGSRWELNNNKTRAQTAWVSRWQDAGVRASGKQKALGSQWPTVEQPSQDEGEVLLWSEELGVNIVVCTRLQLISHTQPTSTLSRIKCERDIFIKKCVRSFIEVRHYCWLCFRLYLYYIYIYIYIYICIYVAIQHFPILLSSEWTLDIFSHLTLKKSTFIKDSPEKKHSSFANQLLIISYSSTSTWLVS